MISVMDGKGPEAGDANADDTYKMRVKHIMDIATAYISQAQELIQVSGTTSIDNF